MLLVVTSRDDYTADWVVAELHRRDEPFVRFNTEDYPGETEIRLDPLGSSWLSIRGHMLETASVKSVWYRRPAPARLPSSDAPRRNWEERESRHALRALWRTVSAVWVNHPDDNDRAGSKPEQLRRAASHGFSVPKTLLSNNPLEAQGFIAALPGPAVCKPLVSGDVPAADGSRLFFTTKLTERLVSKLQYLDPVPLLFQELVPKLYDVRVTVIGDSVFATRIESQDDPDGQTDWRKSSPGRLVHRDECLPDEVAARCHDLVRDYNLRFGAIDLARTPDGDYCFFEINPNGQWAWIEQLTQTPLRARLVDLLTAQ